MLNQSGDAAGRLVRHLRPHRTGELRKTALDSLTAEVLQRVDEGCYSGGEDSIVLGSLIYRSLQNALEVHNYRFSRRRYRDNFYTYYGFPWPERPALEGATIVDLGCGALNPFGFLFLFLMLGARRGIAVDLDPVVDWTQAIKALAELAGTMLVAPETIIHGHGIRPEQMLRNIASFDLAKLDAGDPAGLDGDRLVHLCESAYRLSLPEGEADFVFSNAFFEHIPDSEAAVAESARITRKNGVGVHVIDCSDHRRYGDAKVHPLQFLTERHKGELAHGSNRLRIPEFLELFRKHGLEPVLVEDLEQVEITAALRSQFVEPYRSMEDGALRSLIAKVVVRRV